MAHNLAPIIWEQLDLELMSGDATLLELLERLAPNKKKKWTVWVEKLEEIGIDSPADIADMTQEDIGGLKDVPLKRVLESYLKETNAACQDVAGDLVQTSAPGVAGEHGLLSYFLSLNEKFVLRHADLQAKSGLLIVTQCGKQGELRLKLEGATIDRCPNLGPLAKQKGRGRLNAHRKSSSANMPVATSANSMYMFRVCQQDGKKEAILQANSHQIFTAWTEAIEKAGAKAADTRPFKAELRDPQFTIVPIGGSGWQEHLLQPH
jgi:hypothetical protein